jgi:probable phosphoglycerate mutase
LTILLLVRHGETDWIGEKLAGRLPDVHLNAQGRENAERLAAMLGPLKLAAVYSSPLERAVETAEPTARAAGKPIRRNELLQEVDFGELAGKAFTEFRETPLWKMVHREPAKVRYPGGESLVEAQARAVRAIEEIHSLFESETVALFTHSDTIRLAVAHFLKMPLAAYHSLAADPASVSVLYYGRMTVYLAGLNLPAGSPLILRSEGPT